MGVFYHVCSLVALVASFVYSSYDGAGHIYCALVSLAFAVLSISAVLLGRTLTEALKKFLTTTDTA